MLWYNTFVEFLFFGTGALLAVALGDRQLKIRPFWRLLLFIAGISAWVIAAGKGGIGTDGVPGLTLSRLYIGYGAADVGCVLIFVSFLGIRSVPSGIVYLGKISYGLYVFHYGMVKLSVWLLSQTMSLRAMSMWKIVALDGLAFACCAALASVSYRFLEKPFLHIKDRFAFVPSRPAG